MQWVSRTVCTCVCSPSVEPEAYLRGDACRDGVGERSGIPLVGAPSCGHLAGRHGVQEEVTRHIRTQLHHLGVMLRRLLLLRRHRGDGATECGDDKLLTRNLEIRFCHRFAKEPNASHCANALMDLLAGLPVLKEVCSPRIRPHIMNQAGPSQIFFSPSHLPRPFRCPLRTRHPRARNSNSAVPRARHVRGVCGGLRSPHPVLLGQVPQRRRRRKLDWDRRQRKPENHFPGFPLLNLFHPPSPHLAPLSPTPHRSPAFYTLAENR